MVWNLLRWFECRVRFGRRQRSGLRVIGGGCNRWRVFLALHRGISPFVSCVSVVRRPLPFVTTFACYEKIQFRPAVDRAARWPRRGPSTQNIAEASETIGSIGPTTMTMTMFVKHQPFQSFLPVFLIYHSFGDYLGVGHWEAYVGLCMRLKKYYRLRFKWLSDVALCCLFLLQYTDTRTCLTHRRHCSLNLFLCIFYAW